MTEPTPGELSRRADQIQREVDRKVDRGAYAERNRAVDSDLADIERWQEKHDEGHTWLWRLLAATALTALVTLLTFLLQNIGAGP